MFRAWITFILLFCIVFFAGCGDGDENMMESPPQVESISVHEDQELEENTPIIVTFTKEMAQVGINVSGAEGTMTLIGKTATWNPLEVSPGLHTIFIFGTDKSGLPIDGYQPISFFTKTPFSLPPDPNEIVMKSRVADLWFPGKIGSQWIYVTSTGKQEIMKLSDKIEKNGKTYQLVSVSDAAKKLLSDGTSSPLTIFRVDNGQILGFAEPDAKKVEGSLEQELMDALAREDMRIQLGLKESDIADVQINHESTNDWVIIDKTNLKKSGTWRVAKTHTSAWINGQKVMERIQAMTARVIDFSYFNGEFLHDLPVVSIEYYIVDEDRDGKVLNSYFLYKISVSPEVGMVEFIGTKGSSEEIVQYSIVK